MEPGGQGWGERSGAGSGQQPLFLHMDVTTVASKGAKLFSISETRKSRPQVELG
jgi:hypothetical protein